MLECRASGWEWDEVYHFNADEFKEVYHGLQRNNARANLRMFGTLGQAFGGSKESIKEFLAQESQWLPVCERPGGAGDALDFIEALKRGRKK